MSNPASQPCAINAHADRHCSSLNSGLTLPPSRPAKIGCCTEDRSSQQGSSVATLSDDFAAEDHARRVVDGTSPGRRNSLLGGELPSGMAKFHPYPGRGLRQPPTRQKIRCRVLMAAAVAVVTAGLLSGCGTQRWYCFDHGDPAPHHYGHPIKGDHPCRDDELPDGPNPADQ